MFRMSSSLRALGGAHALAAGLVLGAAGVPVGAASDAAPRVFFVGGEASLLRRPGAPRPLARGESLRPGDVLSTGEHGHVQFALADGARIALQPASEVQLPAADEADLRLVAGGLRVQSATSAARFALQTLRARVQVRGAAFTAAYNPDGSFNIASEREPVEVCTEAGCATAADDNLRVRADNLAPTATNARPTWR